MSIKPVLPDMDRLRELYARYRHLLVAERPELDQRLLAGNMVHAPCFLDIAAGFDCILFDAYGVLNRGPVAIAGAVATLARLRQMGKRFFLVSNNACLSPPQVLTQLRGMGFDLEEQEIVTSGMVIKSAVANSRFQGQPYCLVGTHASALAYAPQPERLMVNFSPSGEARSDMDWRQAAYIVLCSDVEYYGGPQQRLVETLLAERVRPLLMANPDLVAPNSQGSNIWVSGLTVFSLEVRFGLPWIGLGKPFAPVFELALERVGNVPRERILMVGDTLETDVLGGTAMGFATCLTLSGVLSEYRGSLTDLCIQRGIRPDYLVDSIAAR
ncbi:MAG: HAD-IIA family hydrolase [Magnetococcales bacterium]|nr:HAD-IIA family hydrolase [Magnetococcales bacterium]